MRSKWRAREASTFLMKGHLRTDQLLRPVLDRENGLRNGRLLCDVAFFETSHTGEPRLVGPLGWWNQCCTDPRTEEADHPERHRCLALSGNAPSRIAVMSAIEVVSEAVPSTVDAHALTQMGLAGDFGDAEVFGPLALDNALLHSAAKAKGISSHVAGNADCLIVPSVEAGNLLGKAIHVLAGLAFGHIVVGAKVPILIPSRLKTRRPKSILSPWGFCMPAMAA